MMVVKVEVWPFGDEDGRFEIDRIFIINQGAESWRSQYYNYGVFFKDPRGRMDRKAAKRVKRHLRHHDQNEPGTGNARALLSRVFNNIHLVKDKE